MNSTLISLLSLLGGSCLAVATCTLPSSSTPSQQQTKSTAARPAASAIAQSAPATLTAAEFYNRYQDQVSEVPLPACATETSELTQSEMQQIVLEHNRSRADADRHVPSGLPNLPAVAWSCDAAAIAQTWATQSRGTEGHSSRNWREGLLSDRTGLQGNAASLGENLGWAVGSQPSVVDSIVASVVSWDNERDDYNHSNGSCTGMCGHYTQIVWRESTEVGCGVTRDQIDMPGQGTVWPYGYFLACNYHHAGNINGDNPLIDHPDWYYQ